MPNVDTLRPTVPVHPSRILRREMKARGWLFADMLYRCPAMDTRHFLRLLWDKRAHLTPLDAAQLADGFGTSPEFWLNLQRQYDEAMAASEEKRQHDG